MSKPSYRKATLEDGKELAKTLCEADRLEVEGLGHSPDFIPLYILTSDVATAFFDKDGNLAGIAGIGPDGRPGVGVIWMLTTDALSRHPHTFVRTAKKWIAEHSKPYSMLWNLADAGTTRIGNYSSTWGFPQLGRSTLDPNSYPIWR